MPPKVALLCFDNPFLDPMEGGKRVIKSHIRTLAELDIELDVFLFNKPDEGFMDPESRSTGGSVEIYEYPMKRGGFREMLSKYPLSSVKRFTEAAIADLRGQAYDVAIYEGEHMAIYRLERIISAQRHVLYFHDIESVYRAELSRSARGPSMRLAQWIESRKFAQLEGRLREYFDLMLFISRDELASFARKADGVYCPYVVDTISHEMSGMPQGTILYVGDVSLHSNFRSISWFCKSAMPLIERARPDVRLEIVGRVSADNKIALESLSPEGKITCAGYVEDIDLAYDRAALVLSIVQYGAGVKIKTIDALARGQIVVGTSKAVEGTGLESGRHLLVSDTAEGLARACIGVLANREQYAHLVEASLEFLREEHSRDRQRNTFDSVVTV